MIAREPIRTDLPLRDGDAGTFDQEVGSILGDPHLVRALHRSISAATLSPEFVHLVRQDPVGVFRYSRDAAITKFQTSEKRIEVLKRLLTHAADSYHDLETGAG